MENQSDIASACRDWWSVDEELDALTAQYSSVETELIKTFGSVEAAQSDGNAAALLRSFDHRFEGLDNRRANCRQALQHLPVGTIKDTASKLAIAARLLNDEGGFEADVVAEAADFLASLELAP
ncbi:MAG: hypothetical protein KJ690_11260 [Alphaproteobacteria bacterium]|nr:hypothetical protein [Rhizobiaceae bacterium]MBU4136980.1 hypothetical protein [Alphaproteobacteria bacterium]